LMACSSGWGSEPCCTASTAADRLARSPSFRGARPGTPRLLDAVRARSARLIAAESDVVWATSAAPWPKRPQIRPQTADNPRFNDHPTSRRNHWPLQVFCRPSPHRSRRLKIVVSPVRVRVSPLVNRLPWARSIAAPTAATPNCSCVTRKSSGPCRSSVGAAEGVISGVDIFSAVSRKGAVSTDRGEKHAATGRRRRGLWSRRRPQFGRRTPTGPLSERG
jgi:hypothetical protein